MSALQDQANWIARVFQALFPLKLTEQLEDSIDVEQLRHYINWNNRRFDSIDNLLREYVRDFLLNKVSTYCVYDRVRFEAWAFDAARFCHHNGDRSDFVNQFVSSAQYDVGLENIIKINISKKSLSQFLSENKSEFLSALKRLELILRESRSESIKILADIGDRKFTKEGVSAEEIERSIRELNREIALLDSAISQGAASRSMGMFGFEIDSKLDLVSLIEPSVVPAIRATLHEIAQRVRATSAYTALDEDRLKSALEIEKSQSFRNRRGIIPFSVKRVNLDIDLGDNAETSRNVQKMQLYSRIQKTLENIDIGNFRQRLSNQDQILSSLLGELGECIDENQNNSTIINVFLITQGLIDRLKINESKKHEEKIDEDIIWHVKQSITLCNIYLQYFDEMKGIADNIERAAKLHQNIIENKTKLEFDFLHQLAQSQNIFSEKAKNTLDNFDRAVHQEGGPKAAGTTAIASGLVRGSLIGMGTYIIKKIIDAAFESVIKMGKEALKREISSSEIGRNIYKFLDDQKERLVALGQKIPSYFEWVIDLIHLLF